MPRAKARRAALRALAIAALAVFPGAPAAVANQSMCVAANGEVRHQSGTATCEATGKGSVAIVLGDGSSA